MSAESRKFAIACIWLAWVCVVVLGRLDKPEYLRAAIRTYRSLEYLQRTAPPSAGIFGIDNCSRACAPNPLPFHCALCPSGGCDVHKVAADLNRYRPRYVIVPEGSAAMEAALNEGRPWTRIYRDDYFGVYELR